MRNHGILYERLAVDAQEFDSIQMFKIEWEKVA
jgi:hypothetical protein